MKRQLLSWLLDWYESRMRSQLGEVRRQERLLANFIGGWDQTQELLRRVKQKESTLTQLITDINNLNSYVRNPPTTILEDLATKDKQTE